MDELMKDPYGYCPTCGEPGSARERRPNGNDHCDNGHEYPSAEAIRADVAPKLVAPDHRMKVTTLSGLTRDQVREHYKDCINRLAAKGCTFFQLDENDEHTVALVSGWLKQPRMPDLPFVDRFDLTVDQVPA
jgi:hypothetical protein